MTDLGKIEFVACRAGDQPLDSRQCEALMQELPGWEISGSDGIDRLRRVFVFGNFSDALAFTNRVGDLAERYDHHPQLITEWGRVTVTWWTHAIGGLHMNDFIIAAKTSALI